MGNKVLGILGIFMLTGGFGFAQMIEVVVEETIDLKPEKFEYFITLEDPMRDLMMDFEGLEELNEEGENEGENEVYEAEDEEDPLEKQMLDLKMTLDQHKFKYEATEFAASFYGKSDGLKVFANSQADMERLEKIVKSFENATGAIMYAEFEDKSMYFSVVYPKLIEKAKKEADIMAKAAGKSVGAVLAIEEVVEPDNIFDELMKNHELFASSRGILREMGVDPEKREAEFRFKIRFELK